MDLISRKDARKLGLRHYFTGIPCIRGHIVRRYASTGSCTGCAVGNFIKWKANNREQHLQISRAATARNKDRRAAERAANREVYREKARQWYANNKETAKASAKKWEAKNPGYGRIKANNYRSRKIKAPGQYCPDDVKRLYAAQGGKCAMPWCRVNLRGKYHTDHIISLSKGGSNYPSNLQLLCPTCNWRKNSKDPIQFAKENGFLL